MRFPDQKLLKKAANIISWNIWQMDGLAGTIPYCKAEESKQLSMFEWLELEERIREAADAQPHCQIGRTTAYSDIFSVLARSHSILLAESGGKLTDAAVTHRFCHSFQI